MRSYTLIAMLAVLGGCSSQDLASSQTGAEGDEPSVGEVKQKSQFADGTIINLVDPLSAQLTVTADIDPVTVNVYYVSDKTTNAGHQPGGTVTLVDTIDLAADQTKVHNVNLLNSAFKNGYGSIVLDSIGSSPSDVFQTYVTYGGSMFSTGGSVFTGGSYRIPYLSGTLRVVLALTNQSDFAFDVSIANVGTAQARTVNLTPLTTYKFDTLIEGWTLSGNNSIQIFTTAGGTVAVSGYIDRLLQRTRITPVKAAPFP